jgi:hypothetical protein
MSGIAVSTVRWSSRLPRKLASSSPEHSSHRQGQTQTTTIEPYLRHATACAAHSARSRRTRCQSLAHARRGLSGLQAVSKQTRLHSHDRACVKASWAKADCCCHIPWTGSVDCVHALLGHEHSHLCTVTHLAWRRRSSSASAPSAPWAQAPARWPPTAQTCLHGHKPWNPVPYSLTPRQHKAMLQGSICPSCRIRGQEESHLDHIAGWAGAPRTSHSCSVPS